MSKLGKVTKKFSIFILMLVCCATLGYATVSAAENQVSVSIPVEQTFTTNDTKVDNTFSYKLTPLDPTNPMPANSENGTYAFTIAGTRNVEVEPMTYVTPGVYQYKLELIQKGTGYSSKITIYQISVHVMNDSKGGLTHQIVAQNADGEKVGKVLFENNYKASGDKGNEVEQRPSIDAPSDSVSSGDQTNLMMWLGIICISSVAIGVIVARKRKEKKI